MNFPVDGPTYKRSLAHAKNELSKQIETAQQQNAALEAASKAKEKDSDERLAAVQEKLNSLQKNLDALETAPAEITGEVFIVTPFRGNTRLGRVSVSLYDRTETEKIIAEQKARSVAALQELQPRLDAATNELAAATEADDAAKAIQQTEINIIENKLASVGGYMVNPTEKPDREYASGGTARRKEIAVAENDRLQREADRYRTFESYHALFPAPIVSTKRLYGRFHLSVPHGVDVIVVAIADQSAGYGSENYHWVLEVPRRRRLLRKLL